MLHIPGLYIAESEGRGRGVYTGHDVSVGDTIEVCPLLILPPEQLELINQTKLYDYYFIWPEKENAICFALGYGCLYNHSDQPNAEVELDALNDDFLIKCIQPIEAGDEIFINYTGDGKSQTELWFKSI